MAEKSHVVGGSYSYPRRAEGAESSAIPWHAPPWETELKDRLPCMLYSIRGIGHPYESKETASFIRKSSCRIRAASLPTFPPGLSTPSSPSKCVDDSVPSTYWARTSSTSISSSRVSPSSGLPAHSFSSSQYGLSPNCLIPSVNTFFAPQPQYAHIFMLKPASADQNRAKSLLSPSSVPLLNFCVTIRVREPTASGCSSAPPSSPARGLAWV